MNNMCGKLMIMIFLTLPLIGCNGGGSGENGNGTPIQSVSFTQETNGQEFSGTITTPEPTTFLLMGSGIVFAIKNRRKIIK